jgi:hypothetical protein
LSRSSAIYIFYLLRSINVKAKKQISSPGQSSNDCPDIIVKVFKIKLDALLVDLAKCGDMGMAVVWCYVIEFQKRGLPHAPCMLEGKCFRWCPKPFCRETVREEEKYQAYRQRDNGKEVLKFCKRRGTPVALNNCWVAPHKPYVLKRYPLVR